MKRREPPISYKILFFFMFAGWVNDDVSYSVRPEDMSSSSSSDDSSSEEDDDQPKRGRKKRAEKRNVEKT